MPPATVRRRDKRGHELKRTKKKPAKPQHKGPAAAAAPPPAAAPDGESGEADDFEGQFIGGGGGGAPQQQQLPAGKKAKKRRKPAGRALSAAAFEASRAEAAAIAAASAAEQADWLWRSAAAHLDADPEDAAARAGLTAAAMAPLSRGAAPLEAKLKQVVPGGGWRGQFCAPDRPAGQPSALFLSASAVGALAMARACPAFGEACRVAKLFAKHLKVEEQVAELRAAPLCIGAGTPNRVAKLFELGALTTERLRLVVLDVRLDAKRRTLLDVPETAADWWALWAGHLRGRAAAGTLRVALWGDGAA
jgi:protein CMS1